jgi:HlyD family secretion protein
MKWHKYFWITIALAALLAGCQTATPAAQQPTGIPPVVSDDRVEVEGKLVPVEHVALSFNMGGIVSQVLAEEGDAVSAGQVLAELDQRPRLEAGVASAELELVNARQMLKTLDETAGVTTAATQQRVASARDGVKAAQRYLDNLNSGSRQTDIDTARANVTILKDRLEKAKEDYSSYENKPEDNVTRAGYLSRMADAQQRYDDAVRLLNNLQGTPSEIDLAVAEANLSLAQAELALAESDYTDVQSGPDPDSLEAAQARLLAAEAGLVAANASLEDAQLVAPFSGTLVKLDLKVGEQAIPGMQVVVVADFSSWVVETDDLNEMEAPFLQAGQSAEIIPQALTDLVLAGKVDSISQYYQEKFGDIVYTAKIELLSGDPRLRWGMTVTVNFEK